MLNHFYQTHAEQIETMAASWLDSGAASFSLVEGGQLVASWRRADDQNKERLRAPILCRGAEVGMLQVTGVGNQKYQKRLEAEASFLSYVAKLETETEALAGELIETQDQLVALYDVSRATRNELEMPRVLRAILGALQQMIPSEVVFAWLQIDHQELLVQQVPENKLGIEKIQWGVEKVQNVVEPYICNGSDVDCTLPEAIEQILIIPMLNRGRFIGAIGLANRLAGKYGMPEQRLLEAVGQQAEAMIDNALLHAASLRQARTEAEMAVAQKVQLQLLPRQAPAVPGLDIAASSLPARQVGGDFYDFVYTPNKSLIFTLGDVAGKGMPSALLMTICRTAIRSASNSLAEPLPQQILDRINEELYDDFTDVGMFATVFVGFYEVGAAEMTVASAGHSPVYLVPAFGEVQLLQAEGTAVGVLPTNLAGNQVIPFAPGDILVVGTDGYNEARNEKDEMLGYERLSRLIDENRHLAAQEILDKLNQAVHQFSQAKEQDDDQTMIVIKGVTP